MDIFTLREAAWSLESLSCSLQQKNKADDVALHRAVRLAVEGELRAAAGDLPGLSATVPKQLTVNGAGAFEVGGPEGDNGLSGKKLVVDAYGPRVPIGGGAWSGKDFYKADRAGGLHARRLAKFIVQAGLADEATVTLQWCPGEREARVRLQPQVGRGVDARERVRVRGKVRAAVLAVAARQQADARAGGRVGGRRWSDREGGGGGRVRGGGGRRPGAGGRGRGGRRGRRGGRRGGGRGERGRRARECGGTKAV